MFDFVVKYNLLVVYKYWIQELQINVGLIYMFGSLCFYDDLNILWFNDLCILIFQDFSLNLSYLIELFGYFIIVYVLVSNVFGFEQFFGECFGNQLDFNGWFIFMVICLLALRFFFVGVFVFIGEGSIFSN